MFFRLALIIALAWPLAARPASPIGAPEGWRAETFPFPLAFAPSIPYEGTEHVRFSPTWSKWDQPDGFTYVYLWDIKRTPMEAARLERALQVYFDGLLENVARGRQIREDPVATAVTLHPLAAPAGWADAYAGSVYTWNPFNKGEDLHLNAEITQRPCPDGRMQIFFAMSKAKRVEAEPWTQLRKIRAATGC
jgi:hypothetical protein